MKPRRIYFPAAALRIVTVDVDSFLRAATAATRFEGSIDSYSF
jgi:hypothetical protein